MKYLGAILDNETVSTKEMRLSSFDRQYIPRAPVVQIAAGIYKSNKQGTYTVNHKKTWHFIFDYNVG